MSRARPRRRRGPAPTPVEQAGERVGQADRGERRGEEADEGEAELDDGEEPARVVEQAADAPGARGGPRRRAARRGSGGSTTSAISAATKNAVEQRQDDDDQDLEDRAVHGRSPVGLVRRAGGLAGSRAARGSGPGRRRPACPAGTSRVTTAPAPVLAPSPMSTRRDEHRVDADERALADRRAVLAAAVVVGGDRARRRCCAARRRRRRRGSSCGAASSPRPRRLFLSSAKLPISAPRPTTVPGRRWLNGPIGRVVLDLDDSTTLAQTRHRCPIVASTSWLPGADHAALPDRGRAAQDDVGLEGHVGAELDVASR